MTERRHPDILAPPPLLYLLALGLMIALHWLWPFPILAHPVTRWMGSGVIVLGLALNLWGAYAMRRARSPINPYHPARAVVTSGAFRRSRNPLYVGLNLIFLGLSLVMNSLWGVALLVVLLLVMHYGVILPEERYLEAKFGESYRRYRESVRRYL